MIPSDLAARLLLCSDAELKVFWRAADTLLVGLEKGRAQYGSTPGLDGRDYVQEAMDELRDAALYLAMHRIQRAAANPPARSEAGEASRDEAVVSSSLDDLASSWDDRIAEGSAENVACSRCGATINYVCTGGTPCAERVAANRLRLSLPEHDTCSCWKCQRFRSLK